MAIDNMQGKVSTTGMMNQKPSVPKAANLTSLGKQEPTPVPKKPFDAVPTQLDKSVKKPKKINNLNFIF